MRVSGHETLLGRALVTTTHRVGSDPTSVRTVGVPISSARERGQVRTAECQGSRSALTAFRSDEHDGSGLTGSRWVRGVCLRDSLRAGRSYRDFDLGTENLI